MRRLAATAVAAALPFTLLAFAPLDDGTSTEGDEGVTSEEDGLVLPDPVSVTMYFHGDDATPILDEDTYAGDSSGILSMDRIAPVDNSYETRQVTNYAQGPNARCAGNGLLPVWVGFAGKGTLTGFGTVTFRALGSTGGTVVVDVFTDVSGQACNESYPEPVASTEVALPQGEGEVTAVLDLDGVRPTTYLMVQIRGADSPNGVDNPVGDPGAPVWPSRILPNDPTAQTRVVYDGTNFLSNITFTCQPDEVTFDDEGNPSHSSDCLPF